MTDTTGEAPQEYFAAGFAETDERQRLDLLEAAMDPNTVNHLLRLGVGHGDRSWRCIDVGAGGGSIVRWLADRCGPDGSVVGADTDIRFLEEIGHPNVEVQRLDIEADELPPLGFDLVHCRLLLIHVQDPHAALQKMADAVAPGGLLLVEEWDYGTIRPNDAEHPAASVVDKVNEALFDLTLGFGINIYLGRQLPEMMEQVGLTDVGHMGTISVTQGTPEPTMAKASTALLRGPLLARGAVTEAELGGWYDGLSDPSFRMLDYTTMSVWAKRPPL